MFCFISLLLKHCTLTSGYAQKYCKSYLQYTCKYLQHFRKVLQFCKYSQLLKVSHHPSLMTGGLLILFQLTKTGRQWDLEKRSLNPGGLSSRFACNTIILNRLSSSEHGGGNGCSYSQKPASFAVTSNWTLA